MSYVDERRPTPFLSPAWATPGSRGAGAFAGSSLTSASKIGGFGVRRASVEKRGFSSRSGWLSTSPRIPPSRVCFPDRPGSAHGGGSCSGGTSVHLTTMVTLGYEERLLLSVAGGKCLYCSLLCTVILSRKTSEKNNLPKSTLYPRQGGVLAKVLEQTSQVYPEFTQWQGVDSALGELGGLQQWDRWAGAWLGACAPLLCGAPEVSGRCQPRGAWSEEGA